MKKTYTLKLGCFNCFHKWSQDFPFGSDVEEGCVADYLSCNSKAITCPNCGSFKTHTQGGL